MVVYKIIEGTDEKFKTNPSVDEEVSDRCSRIKLNYYRFEDNASGILQWLESLRTWSRETGRHGKWYSLADKSVPKEA